MYAKDVVVKDERAPGAVDDRLPRRCGCRSTAGCCPAQQRLELREIHLAEREVHVAAANGIVAPAADAVGVEEPRGRLETDVALEAHDVDERTLAVRRRGSRIEGGEHGD